MAFILRDLYTVYDKGLRPKSFFKTHLVTSIDLHQFLGSEQPAPSPDLQFYCYWGCLREKGSRGSKGSHCCTIRSVSAGGKHEQKSLRDREGPHRSAGLLWYTTLRMDPPTDPWWVLQSNCGTTRMCVCVCICVLIKVLTSKRNTSPTLSVCGWITYTVSICHHLYSPACI